MRSLAPLLLKLAASLLPAMLSWSALAGEYGLERYPIPGHGSLVLNEPRAWQAKFVQPAGARPPTLVIYPLSEPRFQLFITVFWYDGYDRDVTSRKAIRALLEKVGREVLKMSAQSALDIKEIPGLRQPGYMYELDDSSAAEGEYSHVAQGALVVGDLLVTFTLLTHAGGTPDQQAVMEMLRTARQVGRAGGAAKRSGRTQSAYRALAVSTGSRRAARNAVRNPAGSSSALACASPGVAGLCDSVQEGLAPLSLSQ